MSNISQTFLNLSCFDCKCRALMNSSLGWNCLTLNNSCILIRNYSSNDNGLLSMNNSTFFFQEFPSTLTTTMSTSTSTRSTTSEYLFSFQICSIIIIIIHILAPSCTSQGSANLLTINGPLIYTLYKCNYTATHSSPTLSFVVYGGPASETVYLDDVSVIDNIAPTTELLINPGFENSTAVITGWTKQCASSCTTSGDGGYVYLSQTFSVIVGHNYTVSFWLYKSNGGAGYFYANID